MNKETANKIKYPESEGWITAKLTLRTSEKMPESEIRKHLFGDRKQIEIVEYKQSGKTLNFIYRELKS